MILKNKVAVVTGGAKGIGAAIVTAMAEQGAQVVINYHSSDEAADALVTKLTTCGHQVTKYKANVASFDEAQALIDYTVSTYGRIDILINNSGITRDNLIMRMQENDFDDVIAINLKGAWNCLKHAAKYMTKQRGGKIINITSVAGILGNAGQTNYSAAKAGMIGLTKSAARELAKRNVCVNAIAPGLIKTQMIETLSEEMVQTILSSIPLGSLGNPEDVANAVLFLASDMANYITGHVLCVDGGMAM